MSFADHGSPFALLVVLVLSTQLSACSVFGDEEPWQQRDLIISGRPAAFDPDDGGETGIYAVNLDGSGLVPILTSNSEVFISPSVSPDGSKLVFQSSLGATTLGSRLYVVPFEGAPLSWAWESGVIWSEKFFVGFDARWWTNDTFAYLDCPTCELGGTEMRLLKANVRDRTVRELDFADAVFVVPGPDSTYALAREHGPPQHRGQDIFLRRGSAPNAFERILVDGGANGFDWSPSGHALAYIDIGNSFDYVDLVVVDTLGVEQVRHNLVPPDMADSIRLGGPLTWLPGQPTVLASQITFASSSNFRYGLVAIDLDDGSVREILDGHTHFQASLNPLGRLAAAN